eukprot:COSAG05_NODE_147_length_16383_cov_266.102555_3_plen_78_part_00
MTAVLTALAQHREQSMPERSSIHRVPYQGGLLSGVADVVLEASKRRATSVEMRPLSASGAWLNWAFCNCGSGAFSVC